MHARVESFVIGPDFHLPDLASIADIDCVKWSAPVALTTTYVDTSDNALATRGITIHVERSGDTATWFATSHGLHRRLVIGTDPDLGAVAALTRGLTRNRELCPVLALITERTTAQAFDREGRLLVVIDIDRASAYDVNSPARRISFDELTLHFEVAGSAGLADYLRRKVVNRGALPIEQIGQPARFLGVHTPERPRRLSGLIQDYLIGQFDTILLSDVALRRAADAALETRQAVRRVLGVLRVMSDVFEADPTRKLATELTWFGGKLSAAGDGHIRCTMLRTALNSSSVAPGHLAGQQVVRDQLDIDRRVAQRELRTSMEAARYDDLLAMVADWRTRLPVTASALKAKRRSVRRYLDRVDAELEWRLSAVQQAPRDHAMRAARQAARRARFIAELAQPALGKDAQRCLGHAIDIQERLGEHHEAIVTSGISAGLATATDGTVKQLQISLDPDIERAISLARDRSLRVLTTR